jgi:SAM-dependent methyltransferase
MIRDEVAGRHSTHDAAFGRKSYWENRLSAHPGLCGVGNTILGPSYIEWLYRMRRTIFLRRMHALDLDYRASSVLDIGSGTGFYLKLWKDLGVSTLSGCDLTDVAVSRLRKEFTEVRIEQLDIGDELPATLASQYAIVSAFDILFHIVDDRRYEQALYNVHSLLEPGGLFIFSDLLIHGIPLRDDYMACRSFDEITGQLQKTGFEVLYRGPTFILMEQPLDSQNHIYRFLWRLMARAIRISDHLGYIAGALLYPADLLLTRIWRESPTTEIVVCRKRPKRESPE